MKEIICKDAKELFKKALELQKNGYAIKLYSIPSKGIFKIIFKKNNHGRNI